MRLIDLSGQTFGRLTVKSQLDVRSRFGSVRWMCSCECGNTTTVLSGDLRKGTTKSCGCLRDGTQSITHGISRKSTRLTYQRWKDMLKRCYSQKYHAYQSYGGRGIEVCDRWKDDPAAFYADMGDCPEGLTLDRIDNDKDYSPDNCRWATWEVQYANKRNQRSLLSA